MSSEENFEVLICRNGSSGVLEIPAEARALYDSEEDMAADILSQYLNSREWSEQIDDNRNFRVRVTLCSCEDCRSEYRERIGSRPQI